LEILEKSAMGIHDSQLANEYYPNVSRSKGEAYIRTFRCKHPAFYNLFLKKYKSRT
jgi:hypothetical protein